jgi:periplasmic protein TonB
MSRKSGNGAAPAPELFSTLVASRPPREGRAGAFASATSVVVHAGVIALLFWATMSVGEALEPREVIIDLVPVELPKPVPPAPALPDAAPPMDAPSTDGPLGRPALPTITEIPVEIPAPSLGSTIDYRSMLDDGPIGDPNGSADSTVTSDDVGAGPIFTPMTVRPTIRNMDEVARALQRFYPPLLRDAGIGGTVVVWILIDEQGNVERTQVQRSSGQAALDDAALRVGEVIDFSPAMNRDRPARVWVQWPIAFRSSR